MRKRIGIVFLLLTITLIGAGCRKKPLVVTGVPAGVSQKEVTDWYTAVGALDTVAGIADDATTSAIAIHNVNGLDGKSLFDGDKYTNTLTALGKLAQIGIHGEKVLKGLPQHFGDNAKSQINALLDDAIKNLEQANTEGLTGIKDKDKAADLNSKFEQIRASIQILRLLVAANNVGGN